MSQGDATITFSGNTADVPELRYLPNGTPICKVKVIVTGRKRNAQTGKWDDDKSKTWFVTAFNSLAEHVAESCPKGARVMVTGTVSDRTWEDDASEKHYFTEVVAEDIGASMKWATVKVVKTERKSEQSTEQATTAKEDDPWATARA